MDSRRSLPYLPTIPAHSHKTRIPGGMIDHNQDPYAQTAVAPYALRARPGAPVATPLLWEEALASDMAPDRYAIASIFRRLGQTGDPWRAIDEDPIKAQRLVVED